MDQLHEGEHYQLLLPAISICFLKEQLFPDVSSPHLRFTLSDAEHGVRLCDALEIHTIELPKYNFRVVPAAADPLAQWAFLLDQAAGLEPAELRRLLPGPQYMKATEIMETIARTPQERQLYESRRKAEMDYRSGLDEAMEIGLHRGREEGLEKGERLALMAQVRSLQGLLPEPLCSEAELPALSVTELRRFCDQLIERLRPGR